MKSLSNLLNTIRHNRGALMLGTLCILTLQSNTEGCMDPNRTITGTLVSHHITAVNHGETNLELRLTPVNPAMGVDTTFYDIMSQDAGCPGFASWDWPECELKATLRRNSDDKVLDTAKFTLNSNRKDQQVQTCEGTFTVASWLDVSGGHIKVAKEHSFVLNRGRAESWARPERR